MSEDSPAFDETANAPVDYDRVIRDRIEKRIKNRNQFFFQLAFAVAANAVLWYIYAAVGDHMVAWPALFSLPWAVWLVSMGLGVYRDSERAADRRELMIQQKIEREKLRMGLANSAYEKPKREPTMQLGDDGELVAVDETDDSDTALYQKSQRG